MRQRLWSFKEWLKHILDFVHKYNMCTSKTLPKKDRFTMSVVDDIMQNGEKILLCPFCLLKLTDST